MKILLICFGACLGFVFSKLGVVHYDVIRDMFLLRSFHLYGVMGIAGTGTVAVALVLRRQKVRALMTGEPIPLLKDPPSGKNFLGGLLNGAAWAVTGACPAAALTQIGYGLLPGIFTIAGVFVGLIIHNKVTGDISEMT